VRRIASMRASLGVADRCQRPPNDRARPASLISSRRSSLPGRRDSGTPCVRGIALGLKANHKRQTMEEDKTRSGPPRMKGPCSQRRGAVEDGLVLAALAAGKLVASLEDGGGRSGPPPPAAGAGGVLAALMIHPCPGRSPERSVGTSHRELMRQRATRQLQPVGDQSEPSGPPPGACPARRSVVGSEVGVLRMWVPPGSPRRCARGTSGLLGRTPLLTRVRLHRVQRSPRLSAPISEVRRLLVPAPIQQAPVDLVAAPVGRFVIQREPTEGVDA
jgi:hypothetical protein